MQKKIELVLEKENPTITDIVEGYLLEKSMKAQNKKTEFIIKCAKIDKDIIRTCLSYGFDVEKHHKALSENGSSISLTKNTPNFIYNLCKGKEDIFTKEDLSLAIMILLKKQIFFFNRSVEEKIWVKEVVEKYQLPYKKIYLDSLSITPLDSLTRASMHGIEIHKTKESKTGSSYINLYPDKGSYLFEIGEMLQIIENYAYEQKLDFFHFYVRDFYNFETTLYKIMGRDVLEQKYSMILAKEEMDSIVKKEMQPSLPSYPKTKQKKQITI